MNYKAVKGTDGKTMFVPDEITMENKDQIEQKWEEEFENHPRIKIIQEIIGCQKRGANKERYIELWEELWNDDVYELESFISKHIALARQEEREKIREMIGKHNAQILNEFQLLGEDERPKLIPAIEKATKETLALLPANEKES